MTKADGSFSIPNLPAGEHKVEYWHEKLGKKVMSVTVTANQVATVDLVMNK